MDKNIYIEPAGRWHSFLTQLKNTPPDGYRFITPPSSFDKAVSPLLKSNFVYFTLQRLALERLIPMHLVKARFEGIFKKTPPGTDLTYSIGHVIYRNEPWVVAVEWVTQLFGYSQKHLKRYKRHVENILTSANCKKIICWSELSAKTVLLNLDQDLIGEKLAIVPHAVNKKHFTKEYRRDKVKLLFVGSANIMGDFDLKGGKEVLAGFVKLLQKYNNLELVVRSDIPPKLKSQYAGTPGLRIIDKIIPWPEIEREFKTSDILLFPGHHTPFMTFLDVMSYEIPIISTDAYSNAEMVEDGKTGLIIQCSKNVPYFLENSVPGGHTSEFRKAIQSIDNNVVDELVEKTSRLIDNPELRRQMGKAGRWKIEQGPNSVTHRNQLLKKIFDEATK
jgi:glycosyltransferase involved in cell wall biosynthesis